MMCPEVKQIIQRLIWDHGPHSLPRQCMNCGVRLGTVGHPCFLAALVSLSTALLSDNLIVADRSECLWVAARDLSVL